VLTLAAANAALAQAGGAFYTVPPCRILDTRNAAGPFGGPALVVGAVRSFAVGGRCGVSSGAMAVAANVTVVIPGSNGMLNVIPAGRGPTGTSTLNFNAGRVRANNALLGLGTAGAVEVQATLSAGAQADVIIDVFGYFANSAAETSSTAPPAFSPPPGTYVGEQSIELVSTTPGAQIRYTTDGTAPSPTQGTLYSGPVSLGNSATLRAIAYATGRTNSAVVAGAYSIVRQPLMLLATLTPQGGALTLGSGQASLLLAGNEQSGVFRASWSNLTGALSSWHIHAPDGSIIFDIDTAPVAADGSRTWNVIDAGTWTRSRILTALKAGECYVNLHTASYPSGEIKGFLRPSSGSSTFTPPPPPPPLPGGPPSSFDAARFLIQASYGPTLEDVNSVTQLGYAGWINQQMAMPIVSHLGYVDALPGPREELPSEHTRESIWKLAIMGNDQLRQRVALALSEILVVSDQDDDLGGAEGVALYMDILQRNAFGNFRNLLQEVTLSPAMGVYLDMLSNDKEDPDSGRNPNENFARELLQLFSIGLYRLHPDGTLQLGADGLPIPTYDQDVVKGFARVFTGWTFAGQDRSEDWRFYWPEENFRQPMELWSQHHSTGSKRLLDGVEVNNAAQYELDVALNTVFNHPNVGPFLCRHLIQRLVTANPSPAYIYRCASAFANNGAGVRGDLGAVVRTILLDWEARSVEARAQAGFGHVREPLVRMVHLLRTLHAAPPADGRFRYYWTGSAEWGINQAPLSAPTVFNFFDPNYAQPGPIAQAGLVSPELQITNETSVFGTANYLSWVLRGNADEDTVVTLTWAYVTGVPNDAAMLDRINLLFYGGGMSTATRTALANALANPNFPRNTTDSPNRRVRSLMWLVFNSPDFVAAH
jgi:uncharacterized protein (DUF1800 family)